jgi:hypothetical protein
LNPQTFVPVQRHGLYAISGLQSASGPGIATRTFPAFSSITARQAQVNVRRGFSH